jgi:membrane protease YdiL (CAAX protease family)
MRLLASRTHTSVLASAYILIGIAGIYADSAGLQGASPNGQPTMQIYASALLLEWAAVFYVWKGTRCNDVRLVDLIGGRWQRPLDFITDVLLAVALWGIWIGIESILPDAGTVSALLPRSRMELLVWMAVSLSAGFCEELVFRGYFQRQFQALTGSLAAGIALQAVLFGIGHSYEGAWAVAKITVYGVLFGVLASSRKSLRPGMLAHAWSDIFAVL